MLREESKYMAEGIRYLAKGDKEMKRIAIFTSSLAGFFARLFGSEDERHTNAKDFYQKASNCFKLAKQCTLFLGHQIVDKAAEAYLKTAQCEPDEAMRAGILVEAASNIKRVNTSEAVKLLEKGIEAYCSTGGIRMVRSGM